MLLVFGVGLEVHCPLRCIQVGNLQWNSVPSGVDGALDGFGIPLHVNEDGYFLAGGGVPFAMPGAGQRMSFLRPSRHRKFRQNQKTEPKERSSAHYSSKFASRGHSIWRLGENARTPSETALFRAIENVPDAARLAIANVQRAIGRFGYAVRPRHGVVGIHQRSFAGKSAREYLEVASRLSAREGLERHVIAGLRQRRAVPGSVKCDERAALVFLGKFLAGIEHDVHRRPMRGEGCNGSREGAATVRGLAVSAIFGIGEKFLLSVIVEAIRPAEVGALLGAIQRLGGTVGIFLRRELARPHDVQLIAIVHGYIERAIVPRD